MSLVAADCAAAGSVWESSTFASIVMPSAPASSSAAADLLDRDVRGLLARGSERAEVTGLGDQDSDVQVKRRVRYVLTGSTAVALVIVVATGGDSERKRNDGSGGRNQPKPMH